jgi:hypothetical protein
MQAIAKVYYPYPNPGVILSNLKVYKRIYGKNDVKIFIATLLNAVSITAFYAHIFEIENGFFNSLSSKT